MSAFYNINHFHRLHLSHPERFLLSVPEERRKHIGHISVEYRMTSDTKYTGPAFELLTSVTRLSRLDIRTDEQEGLQYRGHVNPPCPTVADIPGLDMLLSVRAEEVNFYGNCPTSEQALKADTLKLRIEAKSVGGEKKRKTRPDGEQRTAKRRE